MSAANSVFSRPEKLSDAQTVLYEIDMLRFARERLLSPEPSRTDADQWVYLEAFLLHYRNLIEFFGKPEPRVGDLNILRPERIWPRGSPDKTVLDSMIRLDLWEEYDTADNDLAISKYLHHCTTQRTVARDWNPETMYEELRPTIERFESLLPEYKPATGLTRTRGIHPASLQSNSTATTRILGQG